MRWAIVAVVVVVAATFALIVRPPIKQPTLAHKLIAMQREVDFRAVSVAPGQQFSLSNLPDVLKNQFEDQVKQDRRHQDTLSGLLDSYGWPTKKMVGREGVNAALLVVDRAPDLAFKQRAIGLIQQAGEDDNEQYALLVDLVAVMQQLPQTYGTQWSCEPNGDGSLRVHLTTPLKDPRHVVALRRKVGLGAKDRFAERACSGDYRIIKRRVP